jgi:hypothetical protein
MAAAGLLRLRRAAQPRSCAHSQETPLPRRCRDSLEPDVGAWRGKNLSAAQWWSELGGWRYMREDTHRVIMIANNTVLFPLNLNKGNVTTCQMPCNGHVSAAALAAAGAPARVLALPCQCQLPGTRSPQNAPPRTTAGALATCPAAGGDPQGAGQDDTDHAAAQHGLPSRRVGQLLWWAPALRSRRPRGPGATSCLQTLPGLAADRRRRVRAAALQAPA